MKHFSLQHYTEILKTIQDAYTLVPACKALQIFQPEEKGKCILRHDVDYSLTHALRMARLEKDLGIQATYYFLLDSNWYNLFNQDEMKKLKELCTLGHEIGLHFNAGTLVENKENWKAVLQRQKSVLENLAGQEVVSFSYHCPGVVGLDALDRSDTLCQMLNCYSLTLQERFVYRSDSLRKFKDPNFFEALKAGAYNNLHLLIHPILWQEEQMSLDEIINVNIQAYKEKLTDEWDTTKRDYNVAA